MASKDSDNIARLEALRPKYERLRDQKIRADADVERAAADLERAKENARRVAGTDNEDEIREQIRANYERNTVAVDEFEAIMASVQADLDAVGGTA